jgi:superfamily II DNA or RNA helicase
MTDSQISLRFSQGTLLLEGISAEDMPRFLDLKFDKRTQELRAPAFKYRNLILSCIALNKKFSDQARDYSEISCPLQVPLILRPHQQKALEAWTKNSRQGVVSLPTGAGKTLLAVYAISQVQRPTLIIVPTIDLMLQWQGVLQKYFAREIGMLGGGHKNLQAISVATFDTARLMIENVGAKFGFLVVDECHHLPAVGYQLIAQAAIAPFRLGLSATVERSDGGEILLDELLGEVVYEGHISEMTDTVLAPYEVIPIEVALSPEERQAYENSRTIYTNFVRRQNISMSSPQGWQQFIMRSAVSEEGRRAMRAYREQKLLPQRASAKIGALWELLTRHAMDSMIIFTDDNTFAYQIGREFLLPVLTHKTKGTERKQMLESFRGGSLKVMVTSKVLNEGVDVPAASIGVVMSGSGAVREHVQRLGRILRRLPGKRAILYELIAQNTNEQYVNIRRKQHNAYQRAP